MYHKEKKKWAHLALMFLFVGLLIISRRAPRHIAREKESERERSMLSPYVSHKHDIALQPPQPATGGLVGFGLNVLA